MNFKNLKNDMNNSDIDSKFIKHHKSTNRKSTDSKSPDSKSPNSKSHDSKLADSKSHDSKSPDSKSIKHIIHPCNSSGDIIWMQTPYPYIDSHDTNVNHGSLIVNTDLNHESFLNNLLNIFNCFSICNCPEISRPNCNCHGL